MSDPLSSDPSKNCPKCGAALTAGDTRGLCPACLLAEVMQPVPEDAAVTAPVARPSQPRNVVPDLPLPVELTALLPHGMYRVEGFLGQGGMGAVYKGVQVRLKRPVAIKIMRRDFGKDYDFEQRFEREAQAMAKLNHPNIVGVIDYGEAGTDYLYIVMELVDGADLMDVIRTGRMTQEMALALLPQICDALQFAHDHGIVHRDIKPSNIMLTRDGRIKMADFGLAKRFDAESSFRTQTGTGMGTPDYAAPEQFDASAQIDHRADIYALGVMIYQMITGQLPRGVWKPPSQRAEIDPHWDDIVSHAMQSDPKDRYQKASEIKTDVSRITPQSKEGSADTPVRTNQPGGEAAKRQEAGKLRSREANAHPPVKSRAPLVFGILVGAAVITLGTFYALKKPVGDDVKDPIFPAGADGAGLYSISTGRKVDLLALVDVTRDAVFGVWKRTPDGIVGAGAATPENASVPRLQLPYTPPDEYDFEIEFTRTSGNGVVTQLLSAQGSSFGWSILTSGNGIGFDRLDSNIPSSRHEAAATMESQLENGRRYRSRVEVRRGSLRGFLDEKEKVNWNGDFKRLSLVEGWRLPDDISLGLGVANSGITFHKIEVREITGTGKVTSGAEPKTDGQQRLVTASPTNAIPPPATPIQTFAGHRYQFVPGEVTWTEAKTKAEALGGHLATVTSKEEAAWLLTAFASHLAVSTPKLWLGGSATAGDRPWQWVTGEPFDFTDWAEGEPNYITANGPIAGPYAAAITRNPGGLRWTESPANSGRSTGFLVEWDDAGSAPATTAAGAGEQWADGLAEWWAKYPNGKFTDGLELLRREGAGSRTVGTTPIYAGSDLRDAAVRVTALGGGPEWRLCVRAMNGAYEASLQRDGKGNIKLTSQPMKILSSFKLPEKFSFDERHTVEFRCLGDELTFILDGTEMARLRDQAKTWGGVSFQPGIGTLIEKLEYAKLPQPKSEELVGSRANSSLVTSATATKDAPFLNTLGMKFVPVPINGGPTDGKRVLFSVWETRVQDYEAFVKETKADWKKADDVEQGPTHPAVMVSWDDAQAFCQWLTQRERKAGKLGTNELIRLPSDHEWSCAVGIGDKEEAAQSPIEKKRKIAAVFPWGSMWPPPDQAGNYWSEELRPLLAAGKFSKIKGELPGYRDGFATTAPAGRYAANRFGLHDLGGNVWEWCEEWYDDKKEFRTLRGASWDNLDLGGLLSSDRNYNPPGYRSSHYGFRCVVAMSALRATSSPVPPAPAPQVPAPSVAPAFATKDAPFVNSLGMKFVPVPVTGGPTDKQRVLFSVWETRVHDYEVFVKETEREWKKSGLEQGTTHPAVNMSCEDALAFCAWLTETERKTGKLDAQLAYRLPSDHEWSCAVGLGDKEDAAKTPEEKNLQIPVFPWGNQWPPPADAGNYGGLELKPLIDSGKLIGGRTDLGEWLDSFVQTAPCGSFRESRDGLFDLGGNAFEWCNTPWSAHSAGAIIRGGSTHDGQRERLFSSLRVEKSLSTTSANLGFRVVLAPAL